MKNIPNAPGLSAHTPSTASRLATELFSEIGENPHREGLLRTPERFHKAFLELTSGYQLTAENAVGEGIFESESNGIVCVKDIEFFSLCEHHMLPFWGTVSITYLPKGKMLGLSKLARIVDVYSKRLQVQERLTKEVAESIFKLVDAKAVAVVIEAQHMCMMMRGVKKQSSSTRTELLVGSDNISDSDTDRIWKQFEGKGS